MVAATMKHTIKEGYKNQSNRNQKPETRTQSDVKQKSTLKKILIVIKE